MRGILGVIATLCLASVALGASQQQQAIKDRTGKVIAVKVTQQNGRTLTKDSSGRVIEKTAENKATGTRNYYDAKGVLTKTERIGSSDCPARDTVKTKRK
ncbi:MAG: hypothetical protein RR410_05645 [Alistipes sp.]